MIETGRVSINGKPARSAKQPIAPDDRVEVADRPATPRIDPADARRPRPPMEALNILHEDDDLLVANKPPGLITSSTPREKRPTLIALIVAYLQATAPRARAGIIHRLDRDAAGLLVFSKNDETYEHLKHQFFHHTVLREYAAVVRGVPNPPAGRIESRLIENRHGTVLTTRRPTGGQRAITHFETVRHNEKFAQLKVTLETGRKHQIRAHLSEAGHPIIGDTLYPIDRPIDRRATHPAGLMLRAVHLAFAHPRTGQRADFILDLEEDLLALAADPHSDEMSSAK